MGKVQPKIKMLSVVFRYEKSQNNACKQKFTKKQWTNSYLLTKSYIIVVTLLFSTIYL